MRGARSLATMTHASQPCNVLDWNAHILSYHYALLTFRAVGMKTKFEVIIDADRDTVWDVFDNADNIARWQPTLKSFTHKSGLPGEVGAVSELIYAEGNGEMLMSETITEKRRPDFMAGFYEAKWSKSLIVNYFETVDDNKTRWVSHANHNFSGIMKLMTPFVRKTICRRTESDMARFKLLVESQLTSEKS